jgi:hypothetical protein
MLALTIGAIGIKKTYVRYYIRSNMTRLLRSLFIVLLTPILCLGQAQDVLIPPTQGSFILVGKNLSATSGPGGILNNFIFTPAKPDENFCIYLANGSSASMRQQTDYFNAYFAALGYSITLFTTGDSTVNSYATTPQKWHQVGQSTIVAANANSIVTFAYRATSAARINIQIGGAVPATTTMFIVQSPSGSCNGATLSDFGAQGLWPTFQCDQIAQIGVSNTPPGQFVTIVPQDPGGRSIAMCWVELLDTTPAITAAGVPQISYGGPGCAAFIPGNAFNMLMPIAPVYGYHSFYSGGPSALLLPLPNQVNEALCLFGGSLTTGAVFVTVGYAYY